ncbi:hypothetical protein [Actinoplanes sp. NPDC049681]|uniref:hypothetical protein n=1 Tax=Actinoplanes sp. NPDC049681 TaxID=3363905 RepID=UPI0037876331
MSTGSEPGAVAQRTPPPGDDAGFTLVEVVVAIGLLHVLLVALTMFYIRSSAVDQHHGRRQQAARIAADAMERVRALGGSSVWHNRDDKSVHEQPWAQGVDAYVSKVDDLAVDPEAAVGAGASAPVPTSVVTVSQSGTDFEQHWYVARCWQIGTSTDCKPTNEGASTAVPFLRVVVAVTWHDKECAGGICDVISSTLVSDDADPIFYVAPPHTLTKPDIYFLADTTGSMGSALKNVALNAGQILDQVDAVATEPRYGAGQYRDFPVQPFAYRTDAPIPATDDRGASAKAAINTWAASGGGDTPEANLYALHKLVSDAKFRTDSSRIVVWFGDAPGHDPVCSAVSGQATVTEASVTAELVSAKVKVIAVSTTTGPPDGLDDNPASGAGNGYPSKCGSVGGKPGQASRIAAATGGRFFKDVQPKDVADTIIAGISSLR